MNKNQIYITATNARQNFFDLLERVKKGPFPMQITVKGIPEAVLMSQEDYNGMIATMETLADDELMEQIKRSDRAFARGDSITWEELKKELQNEGYLDKETKVSNNEKNVSNNSRTLRKKGSKKDRQNLSKENLLQP